MMDFNNIIKHNFIHRYENNELKTKKYIVTPFLNVSKKQINDVCFRPNLIADVIAKLYRQQNYNVMVNLNCNNLNDEYIINSKVEYNELNDNILFNYLKLIDNLNINYDYNKSIHLNDKDVIKLYQNLFVYLYNNNLIKYESNEVFYDSSYTHIYDRFQTKDLSHKVNEYALFLDISKYINKIIDNIDLLLIDNNLKDSFKEVLGETTKYRLNLKTNNNLDIDIELKEPYELGSLSCVLIGISTLDILEYINPSQISYLESYFKTKTQIYFNTKNYVTNPLTGAKVPIVISKNIKGFKGLFISDKNILKELNIMPINIIDDSNLLINSDYLDGLTISAATKRLVSDFTEEGIINSSKVYLNTKILLSSNNNYGIKAPIMVDDNKMFLLPNRLPIYYDSKFNLNINNGNFKIYDKPLNNSFISLFNYIINIIYDKDREFNDNINDMMLSDINKLLNNSLVIYNKDKELEEILLPIIMISILEQNYNIKLLNRIEFLGVGGSYDNYGYNISENNNNLIYYDQLFKLYNSDSIRLYLLSHNISDKLYFYKDDIFKYKQLLFDLEMITNNLADYNPMLDLESIRFRQTILDNILIYKLDIIISDIIKYIKFLRANKPSKQQIIELLVILYLFMPEIINKINDTNFKNRLDLLTINWSKEM